jgi:hypothetical protein
LNGAAQGSLPAQQGYASALGNLTNSLNLAGNTTSGQISALGQQLQQNQGQVQQGLINSGLGNSTIAQSAQQAPLQTYNQGVLNAQNQGALLQMGAYNNLANTAAQGGQQISNLSQPYQQAAAAKAGQITNLNSQPGGPPANTGYSNPTAGQGQQASQAAQAALLQSIMGQGGGAGSQWQGLNFYGPNANASINGDQSQPAATNQPTYQAPAQQSYYAA